MAARGATSCAMARWCQCSSTTSPPVGGIHQGWDRGQAEGGRITKSFRQIRFRPAHLWPSVTVSSRVWLRSWRSLGRPLSGFVERTSCTAGCQFGGKRNDLQEGQVQNERRRQGERGVRAGAGPAEGPGQAPAQGRSRPACSTVRARKRCRTVETAWRSLVFRETRRPWYSRGASRLSRAARKAVA